MPSMKDKANICEKGILKNNLAIKRNNKLPKETRCCFQIDIFLLLHRVCGTILFGQKCTRKFNHIELCSWIEERHRSSEKISRTSKTLLVTHQHLSGSYIPKPFFLGQTHIHSEHMKKNCFFVGVFLTCNPNRQL